MAPSTILPAEDALFINQRHTPFAAAFNSDNVDTILSYYAPDADFCDFSVDKLHLNKVELTKYYIDMFATCLNMKLKTRSLSGHKHFTAWEWNVEFDHVKPSTEASAASGDDASKTPIASRKIKMVGTSLTWWDEDGKYISKNHDYAKAVEAFEDE